jgi:hypothetical protein
MLVIFSDLI